MDCAHLLTYISLGTCTHTTLAWLCTTDASSRISPLNDLGHNGEYDIILSLSYGTHIK